MLPERRYWLFAMEIDLNGGSKDLLLAAVDPEVPTREQGWFVYLRNAYGSYEPAGGLEFSFLLFRVDENGRLVTWASEIPATISYRVDARGFHEVDRTPAASPESETFAEWRTATALKVYAADFDDVEANRAPAWTDMLTNQPVTGPLSLSTRLLEPSVQPDTGAAIRALKSRTLETRIVALESLIKAGPASAGAVPAVIEMMSRHGWNATELPMACRILKMHGERAPEAFPLLVGWTIASEGDSAVGLCLEDAAMAAGPAGLTKALAASAKAAEHSLPRKHRDFDLMFDTTAMVRGSFVRPIREFGSQAITVLEGALADRNPYVRAEAAGFIALLGPDGRAALPALELALKKESNAWAKHEIAAAIAAIRK